MLSVGIGPLALRAPGLPQAAASARIYADFTTGLTLENGAGAALGTLFTCERPSSGQSRALETFGPHELRRESRGLLIEESRTNHVRHSHAPVPQSIALPAGSYVMSVGAGGSAQITGPTLGPLTATPGAPIGFALSQAETVVLAITSTPLWVQIENGTFATSPIQTANTPGTRDGDNVRLSDHSWFDPAMSEIYLEWEQVQDGSLAQNGVNTLLRWLQPEGFSRLRAGSSTFAQIRGTNGSLSMNKGAGQTTGVGVHWLHWRALPTTMEIEWSASLTGTAGNAQTSSTPSTSPVSELRMGGAGGAEYLNGYLRKLVIT